MDPTLWNRAQTLFDKALQLPAGDRLAFLSDECGDDTVLLEEVTLLLDADDQSDKFMQRIGSSANRLIWEPFQNGEVIGHYRIEQQIGSGGMGIVYKAVDVRLDRPVALKFLHIHRSSSALDKSRFQREAKAASRLAHENICTIYEITENEAGLLYIAMAYCEGHSLNYLLGNGKVTPANALIIIRQLARALVQTHRVGVYHRDLKPANLIIDDELKLKLVDFGIAKIVGEEHTTTSAGFGTAAYMAPEQLRNRAVDHRCDIWSMGVILYEMLTGRRPFQGDTLAEIIDNVFHHHYPTPRELRPELPTGTDHLISRCLARKPDERFNSVQEFLDVLESMEESFAALDSPPTPDISKAAITSERRYVTTLYYRCDDVEIKNRASLLDLVNQLSYSFGGHVIPTDACEGIILFGYPLADEHAAQKAVRCGLRILRQANDMDRELSIAAHVGFILSDIRQATNAAHMLLETQPVRYAATLCERSPQKCFLISKELQRLVVGFFELTPHDTAYRVEKETAAHDRLDTASDETITPLAGRVHELGLLQEGWDRALEGEGQVITISGEPGIGKSRMLYEAKKLVRSHPQAKIVECLCAPYQQNTTLYPVLRYLEKLMGLHHQTDPEERHKRIESFAAENMLASDHTVLVLKLLLESTPAAPVSTSVSPEVMKQETLSLLNQLLLQPAQSAPLLLIFEDLHWADPTTLDLINLLIESCPVANLILLCTYRPSFQPLWHGRSFIANLALNRLNKRNTEAMVRSILSEKSVKAATLKSVVQRTEGIPLFVEELAQAVLESPAEQTQDNTSDTNIPLTLQDSLQARLDALGGAKILAQFAAVIGREFEYSLVRAIGQHTDEDELQNYLKVLVRSKLINQFGSPPDASYRFKHALIRDAAYQSLTSDVRRQQHKAVAEALETDLSYIAETRPETLAHHLSESGEPFRAAQYWQRAGETSLKRYAIIEAVAHCRSGLEQLNGLQSNAEIVQLELALQTTLGPALMALKGYADPDVDHAYSRARDICRTLGDPPMVFPVLFGLWTFNCVRARHPEAHELAEQLVIITNTANNAELKVEAFMVRGITNFFRARFSIAREDFATALSFYKKEEMQQKHILEYGQDPGMVILVYQALNEWKLGDKAKADEKAKMAVELGRQSEHPFSLAYALTFSAWHALNQGYMEQAKQQLEEARKLCEQQKIQIFLVYGAVLVALRKVQLGDLDAIPEIEAAIQSYTQTGARLFLPAWFAVLASGYASRDESEKAAKFIGMANDAVEAGDERWCLPEIQHIEDEILERHASTTGEKNEI